MKKCLGVILYRIYLYSLVICLLLYPSLSLGEAGFSENPDAVERAADSVFMLEVYSPDKQKIAIGSGFVAFDSSTLITNYHVIEGGAYIIAISDDKAQYLITQYCCLDKDRDIAILHFDQATESEPLPLNTNGNLKRSQKVIAIGSPAGLKNTISNGIISAFFTGDGKDWIQFTAAISHGSSGGALFNDEGEIIGITTAQYAATQNVNMAVRIQEVIDLYNKWDRQDLKTIGYIHGDAYSILTSAGRSSESSVVWVSTSGKKYHNNPSCSRMRSPVEMDVLEAIEKGYEPCGKCYK